MDTDNDYSSPLKSSSNRGGVSCAARPEAVPAPTTPSPPRLLRPRPDYSAGADFVHGFVHGSGAVTLPGSGSVK